MENKLHILQTALEQKQPIEFLDNLGKSSLGTVVRISWDDYEDICSIKDTDGRVVTLPVKRIRFVNNSKEGV